MNGFVFCGSENRGIRLPEKEGCTNQSEGTQWLPLGASKPETTFAFFGKVQPWLRVTLGKAVAFPGTGVCRQITLKTEIL